jgi:hypothetical protein
VVVRVPANISFVTIVLVIDRVYLSQSFRRISAERMLVITNAICTRAFTADAVSAADVIRYDPTGSPGRIGATSANDKVIPKVRRRVLSIAQGPTRRDICHRAAPHDDPTLGHSAVPGLEGISDAGELLTRHLGVRPHLDTDIGLACELAGIEGGLPAVLPSTTDRRPSAKVRVRVWVSVQNAVPSCATV